MIGGERLNALEEQRADLVADAEICKGFAVEAGVLAKDLDANGAGDLSVRSFDDLELRQALFEFGRRELHGFPQSLKSREIVEGGASDAVGRGDHDCAIVGSPGRKSKQEDAEFVRVSFEQEGTEENRKRHAEHLLLEQA
jgi:hypothetical protein